jgi:two-component system nitrogen regulation sensor histidine kinase NtrY
MQAVHQVSRPLVTRAHLWTAVAGAALVTGAWWLRSPSVRYLVASIAATGLATVVALRLPRPARRWAVGAVGTLLLFGAVAFVAQCDLDRIERDWPRYRATLVSRGEAALSDEVGVAAAALRDLAARALVAPAEPRRAFDVLAGAVGRHAERGVVLYRAGRPVAWAGRIQLSPDSLSAALGAQEGAFYVTLYAVAERGDARAVATAVISADPPADRLIPAVANRIARRIGLHAIEVSVPDAGHGDAGDWGVAYAPAGDTVLLARAVPPGREEARLLALERVRLVGLVLAALGVFLFLIATWRHERTLGWRLAPLAIALAGVALAPLSTFSSLSVLFDPTVYYVELGGPFTASVGALAGAAAVVLLGLLLVLQARSRFRSRRVAFLVVAAIMGGGPSVLRALSRGVSPPPGGVPDQLWLAWEISLCLAAASLLVAAAAAGGTLVGRRGGLPSFVAPALAALAAFLGPLVLEAPGTWPQWYTVLWIVSIGALALTRRHRWSVFSAATVAALGATTLTWNAGVRGRTALANRDVAGLTAEPPDVVAVLERFGDVIAAQDVPQSAAELVQVYMQSDLVGSGYPVALASWLPTGAPAARVALDPITAPAQEVERLVAGARDTGQRRLAALPAMPGTVLALAVPHRTGGVTTVLVAPRTRLIPDNPFNALLGLEARESGPPPYTISLADPDAGVPLGAGSTRWYRNGSELHGDRLVRTAAGLKRAHIEIELPSQASLVQRGTLVVLLDLVVIAALGMLSALPEPAFWRWMRVRVRRRIHSYRARLTLVLFGFFVLPAFVFALWSYSRLQSEDRQSRELVVREMLRGVVGSDRGIPGGRAEGDADRQGTPLLVYRSGELRQATDPLFDALAPTGRFLPPPAQRALREGHEVYTSVTEVVGGAKSLFGYLATATPSGDPIVIAAPARGREAVLDQRRRDLGVLVLFVTVLGALAALGLSRTASRSLAQPIGRLRRAALAIAAGEREPPLAGRPPEEFEPVFSAFRRMAADLGASRSALEAAQRRTSAVLRNVASGVVAISADGVITLANPRAETLLGRVLPAGIAIRDVSAALADRVQAFLAHGAEEHELELVLGGRQLQARLTRLADGGSGAVLTLDDVTELARAQRVLAWGEMARQVAHEIKNPLTPIRLGVQHLKRAYADARGDFDQILERNAQRILAEIDRLDEIARNFSRYGTAPAERLPATAVDVVAIVRNVVELERLGRGEIEWRLVGTDGPLFALARPDELHEVLLNILENARFAEATRVEVRCGRQDARVVLEVADNGRGIPAAVLPRIFEPHFSTRTSGSGLGLAVSRQLVEGWGGGVAIASTEGEGTTVRIELVVTAPPPPSEPGATEPRAKP